MKGEPLTILHSDEIEISSPHINGGLDYVRHVCREIEVIAACHTTRIQQAAHKLMDLRHKSWPGLQVLVGLSG